MDKRDDMKAETSISMENSVLSDENPASSYGLAGIFDISCEGDKWGSFGFTDLLNVYNHNQDFGDSLFFNSLPPPQPPPILPPPTQQQPLTSPAPESSEVLNNPATPNSPSISSSSNEATANINEEQNKDDENEQNQDKSKKLLKPKKKNNQKRQKEPRFAFMTKTDNDHLDDGYRWRKYGQKAVKNSAHPRSYYRCTTAGCEVKKRVERSSADPSIVITTYEGQHTHPCPITPRGSIGILATAAGTGVVQSANFNASSFVIPQPQYLQLHQQQQQPFIYSSLPPSNLSSSAIAAASANANANASLNPHSFSLLRDHGLLQDIVPSQMRREPKEGN